MARLATALYMYREVIPADATRAHDGTSQMIIRDQLGRALTYLLTLYSYFTPPHHSPHPPRSCVATGLVSSTGQSTSSSVPRIGCSGVVVTRSIALRPAVGVSRATAVLSRLLSLSPSGTRRILADGSAGAGSTHAAGSGHAALSSGRASPPRRRRWPCRASQAGRVSDSAVAMALLDRSLGASLADASRRCMLACLPQVSASCSIRRRCEPRFGSASCAVGSAIVEGSAARAERLASAIADLSAAMSHASWRHAQSPSAAPSASRSTMSSASAVRAADRYSSSWTACALQSAAHSSGVSGSARVDGDASESTGKGLLDGDMPLRYALKSYAPWWRRGTEKRTSRVYLSKGPKDSMT